MLQVSWSLAGNEMRLDQATSDAYSMGDSRVIDEIAADARHLASSLNREIKIVTAPPVETSRSRVLSFAECFAALKAIVSDRADHTICLSIEMWQHNVSIDGNLVWEAWIGSDATHYHADNPQALIALVTAGKHPTRPEDVAL